MSELIAAAHVHTVKAYGPDRVVGFSPIPAMSQVSYAAGTRFLSMIGGTILSFYDWYADMPIASPQVFGDQTDVPESGDWWNSAYLMIWGTNLPITRTPDAHFMTEARYRGQKVVVVSPDYSDHTKFADDWLPAAPGTDGALAMAMGHVILTEFFRDRQVPYFTDYVKTYTDLPFLVTLRERGDALRAGPVPDRRGPRRTTRAKARRTRPCCWTRRPASRVVPNGTLGFRYSDAGPGPVEPRPRRGRPGADPVRPRTTDAVPVDLPRFDVGRDRGRRRRSAAACPAMRVGGRLVTTVFDLLMAQYAVRPRRAARASGRPGYDDAARRTRRRGRRRSPRCRRRRRPGWRGSSPATPSCPRGRSMIAMGAGTNHWFHSDQIYRTFFTLIMLCGCQGVNGGGWAHYVGQEKVRPLTGFQQVAFALDWQRPTRHMTGTSFFYLHTDQWRYEKFGAAELASPLGRGLFARPRRSPTAWPRPSRMGWTPVAPGVRPQPARPCRRGGSRAGKPRRATTSSTNCKAGRLRFAGEDPDDPANFPRVMTVWRANLLGSSGKGMEYFMRHLLGVEDAVRAEESPERPAPGRGDAGGRRRRAASSTCSPPIDFRMTSTCTYSDIVLPAATWYEKHDISTTDMHPFVHSFNPAIAPPWETRTDFDAFARDRRASSPGWPPTTSAPAPTWSPRR